MSGAFAEWIDEGAALVRLGSLGHDALCGSDVAVRRGEPFDTMVPRGGPWAPPHSGNR